MLWPVPRDTGLVVGRSFQSRDAQRSDLPGALAPDRRGTLCRRAAGRG
jgi:hypothetical protein